MAKSSCARAMSLLAAIGKEARVPSSLAGGTGERSNEAAAAEALTEAEEEEVEMSRREEEPSIRGLAAEGGAEEAAFFPPRVQRCVSLREELIAMTKSGGSGKGATTEGN